MNDWHARSSLMLRPSGAGEEDEGGNGQGAPYPLRLPGTAILSESLVLILDWLKQPVDFMREIQASEAKVHLPQLLDEVERGETLIITRHGRRIARIVPEVDQRQEGIDKALAGILELRTRTGTITRAELLSARDEGRKS
jgi:prevent-host-death family protein